MKNGGIDPYQQQRKGTNVKLFEITEQEVGLVESETLILITLGGLLILGPFLKSLMQRIHVPALVAYILLGFLVSVLDQHWQFVNPAFETTFSVLAQLGVVTLLFRVGLKSHTDMLLEKLPKASLIWIGDVLTSATFGFLISRYVLTLPLETSLIIATAFSATSVAVSVSVWDEVHKLGTNTGQLLVDIAELDDLSGVILLAVLLAIIPILHGNEGELIALVGTTSLQVLIKLALFIAGCYLFAHYLERKFTRFSRELEGSTTALTITILGAGLSIAAVAGYLGFSMAIGALFAGLAFSRDPEAVHSDAKFAYFYELFTPFFFINIGMQVDPAALVTALGLGMILFVAAALGKFIGVTGVAMLLLPKSDATLLGISMIPRAEIALVVVHQCRHTLGNVITDEVFAGMVLVSLATSIFSPLLLHHMLEKYTEAESNTASEDA
jgi:Kef-type K+ transport system membrane component KefB